MRTYRELFATPEFAPLFLTSSLQVLASTASGLALSTLVFAATASPLLAALAMFGASFAQVLGATVLLSAADRLAPRSALTVLALVFAAGTAVLALPGLPVVALFAVVLALGVVGSLASGVRLGLLSELLPNEGYLLGRSVLSMAVGVMQIVGYATGGLLLSLLSARGTLLASCAVYAVAAAVAAVGLRSRPARAAGRPSFADTWRGNALLWRSASRRYALLALAVPNGLVVGCESLFVPYSPGRAGVLFAAAAVGMLVGDTLTGRFVPTRWRERLAAPMRLLLAVPYLVFVLRPPFALAVILVAMASVGYSAGLMLQERLVALTPPDLTGHALGLASAGMMTMQGVGAAIAGAVAQLVSPAAAMSVMAVASVAVTLALAPGLATPSPLRPATA